MTTSVPCPQPLPIKKKFGKFPFKITHNSALLLNTDTHLIGSGTKSKKRTTCILYVNFHDIELKAFSKSIS